MPLKGVSPPLSRRARTASRFSWAELDPERRNSLLLIGAISLIVMFALAIVGYGYYVDRIKPGRETVLQVGSARISYAELEDRATSDLKVGYIERDNIEQGIVESLNRMGDEEVLRQLAKSRGMTISEADVDAEIRKELDLNPGLPREQMAEKVASQLRLFGISLDAYRDRLKATIIEDRLRDELDDSIPAESEHASLRIIYVQNEPGILAAKDSINNSIAAGTPPEAAFAIVATTSSDDPSKEKAGDLGYVARGVFEPEIDAIAFSQRGLSEPISTRTGYYLLYVRDVRTQEVTADEKSRILNRSLENIVQPFKDGLAPLLTLKTTQLAKIALKLTQMVTRNA